MACQRTGIWWIGRLQTERDKLRVIEGLEGIVAGAGATFAPLPAAAMRRQAVDQWRKTLESHLYQSVSLELLSCPAMKLTSLPGEKEGDFKARWRWERWKCGRRKSARASPTSRSVRSACAGPPDGRPDAPPPLAGAGGDQIPAFSVLRSGRP
jgi:hypothetical protein